LAAAVAMPSEKQQIPERVVGQTPLLIFFFQLRCSNASG
jgi:hypothetical protein